MFNSKYLITLLNEKWEPLKKIKVKSVPQVNEFLYFEDVQKYYRVINVVHQIAKKQTIIVIITEFSVESIKK
jgi:hypothetical protein